MDIKARGGRGLSARLGFRRPREIRAQHPLISAPAAEVLAGLVDRDAIHPGVQAGRALKAVEVLEGPDVGLLQEIGRGLWIAR